MQPALPLTAILAVEGLFPSPSGGTGDSFLAEMRWFAGNFAPLGWALADGTLLPISTNTPLFSLIGTIYGGDGVTNFAVPDLRGRASLHNGQGPGLTLRTIGEQAGTEFESLTVSQMGSHIHVVQIPASVPALSGIGFALLILAMASTAVMRLRRQTKV